MTIERKLLGTNPSGGGTAATANVSDVFSTYLYTGNATNLTITNGIDLYGEGGLIWTKSRSQVLKHILADSTRSLGSTLYTNTSGPASNDGNILSLNSGGYNIGTSSYINTTNEEYVSWTFRNSPKFFQALSYTGDSSGGRTIAHNLGSAPAMIIVKSTNTDQDWFIYHSSTGSGKFLSFTDGIGTVTANAWNNMGPTDSDFSIGSFINITGRSYVAYLFADNSAEDLNNQMIKCGSYTGDGTNSHVHTDLGWEPQFVLIKNITTSQGDSNWQLLDTARGWGAQESSTTYCGSIPLNANLNRQEFQPNQYYGGITSTGFSMYDLSVSSPGTEYLYMAIRAPMMKEPESATEVFAVDRPSSSGTFTCESGFPVDFFMAKGPDAYDSNYTGTRLTGKTLRPHSTAAEWAVGHSFDFMDKTTIAGTGDYSAWISWLWKRAKGFFDVVAYTGNSVAGHEISHSLGVVPEMMWVKCRSTGYGWQVYSEALGNPNYLKLSDGDAISTATATWNNTSPTASVFTVGTGAEVNTNAATYIAYLFASLAGISKVSGYTGNGSGDYSVTVAYSGGGNKYVINGTPATTLELVEGNTYTFDQSDASNSNHPLRFSTTSNGSHSGGSAYNNGVTVSGTPGTSGSFTRITVPVGAPTLYYYCTNHSNMGGTAYTNVSRIINCGFAAGARFVLIKRTDASGDWYIWDTTRGIVAGNDPHLSLNSVAAELTSDDSIDPTNSGFIVNQLAATNINVANGTYIYLAIA